jgi:tetratricopeptide (TPR) repeat protein
MNGPSEQSERVANDFRTAYAHHRAGRLDEAEALYRNVLSRAPGHVDALNMMGAIALTQNRPERAVQLISEALRHKPAFAPAHSNLGNALLALGRAADAVESYRRAVSLAPSSPGPAYNLFVALRTLGRTAEAEVAIREAITLNPPALDWRRDLAITLIDLERYDDARVILDDLLPLRPDIPKDWHERGVLHYRAGEFVRAREAYSRATALAPADAEAWNGLGLTHRALGDFAEAERAFRRARDIAPDRAEAQRNLGLIAKLREDDAERLTRLAGNTTAPPMERVTAGFALGKFLDEAGRYDEAFEAYRHANALFLTTIGKRFDRAALTADVDRIVASPSPKPHGPASDLPVFVVGMPRSGTSLVEQIAASHPLVHGAGELTDIRRLGESGGDGRLLAEKYIDGLRRRGGDAVRVIDKMPDNVFHLGRIAELFPGARVIFCRRDARDTCLSCFFTLFTTGNLFSFDLADCAHRQCETDRLIDHWLSTLPLAMTTVEYEALVSDLEGVSRRMIAFLGLEWDPACLEFHKTKRAVATASSWQVRQPLYARSVGRWRHYASHLGALQAP